MTSEVPYPPAEQPADGDRTSQVPPPAGNAGPPRYSASASVPVPPSLPPRNDAQRGERADAQRGEPQPSQYGQGWPSPAGQPPTGPARVAATASVPVPPPGQNPYGASPPSASTPPGQASYGSSPAYPTASNVYGGQSNQPAGGPPPPGQYGAPPSHPAPPHSAGPHQAPGGMGGSMGQPSMGGGGMGGGGIGGGGMGGGGMGQPGYPPPGYPTGQEPRGGRGEKIAPTGGWPYVEQPSMPARKSRRWLLITLIAIGAVILIGGAAAIGYAVFVGRGSAYEVGACVRQQGDGAVVVDCDTTGAYEIVSLVDSEDGCPDPTQPSVELTGGGRARQIACLKPVAS